ncbi:MAG: hypothetical protein J5527_09715 [Treponema sp.]|nr:hypothetical protein [Treponema sp.]
MSYLVKYKRFFEILSDMENIDFKSLDVDVSEDVGEDSVWNRIYMTFGLKNTDFWIDIIPEIETLVLDIKKQFNLPKELVLTPWFWIDYIPKIERSIDGLDEFDMYLWFDVDMVLNETFINSLSQKKKDELENNIDEMHDNVMPLLYFDKNTEHEKTENMRRLVNLLYFLRYNMTVYEYLLEYPILDSEIKHKASVERATARLKRLHRQTLDYFRNPNSFFVRIFLL